MFLPVRTFGAFVAVAAMCSAVSARAITPRHFDMGTNTSPVTSGFARVVPGSVYTANNGFGWTVALTAAEGFERPTIPTEVTTLLPTELVVDGIEPRNTARFRVDLAPGSYECAVYLGDVGDPPAVSGVKDQMSVNVLWASSTQPAGVTIATR